MKYLVSYQYHGGLCGNQSCDDADAARLFVSNNIIHWKSHSAFTFADGLAITELNPTTL